MSAFFLVADERYFLGAVGTINSLRLVGHDEPVHVLDAGLTESQRGLLAPHAEIVHGGGDAPPWLLKTVAPLARPADTMVLIDADIVVTRSLAPLLRSAGEGRVVAFENNVDRFSDRWEELLGLGPVERRRYLSSALVALPRDPGLEVLSLMQAKQGLVDFEQTWWRRNVEGYPFLYADQCVFNAVLGARVAAERVEPIDHRLAPMPPFEGLRVADEERLRCEYEDGTEPYLLHHYVTKPWLEPTHEGVYSRLLRRLLTADDVAIRVPAADVPLRLRRGRIAGLERTRINLGERLRWRLGRAT